MSAGYNYVGPHGAIAATTYVYPSPKLVSIGSPQRVVDTARVKLSKDEFARCKREIQQAHPRAVLASEGSFTTADGRAGFMAEFEYVQPFAFAVQPVKSRLYLVTYINGRWSVKHRITFPADKPVQPMVDRSVRDFGPTAVECTIWNTQYSQPGSDPLFASDASQDDIIRRLRAENEQLEMGFASLVKTLEGKGVLSEEEVHCLAPATPPPPQPPIE